MEVQGGGERRAEEKNVVRQVRDDIKGERMFLSIMCVFPCFGHRYYCLFRTDGKKNAGIPSSQAFHAYAT